ncbi:hypothetical protein [Butyricicoccus sp. Marseille-Q5471]|nr:hypothetical protein [Butyricicoccus sp. Marseille-Q5471]
MFCRLQAIGLILISFGVGVLIGGLLPSFLAIWLVSLALIAAGVIIAGL